MRGLESVARGVDEVVLQIFARREGDGVDERVEPAELLADFAEHAVDLGVVGDVARQDERVRHGRAELFDVLLQPLALIGEGQPHPLARQRLRDGPGDGALVGDAENDSGLPFQQRHDARCIECGAMKRMPRRSSSLSFAAAAALFAQKRAFTIEDLYRVESGRRSDARPTDGSRIAFTVTTRDLRARRSGEADLDR